MLAAVEEAGNEEDHRDEKGQLGVLHGVETEADCAVHHPGCKACKPDPCEVSHGDRMRLFA